MHDDWFSRRFSIFYCGCKQPKSVHILFISLCKVTEKRKPITRPPFSVPRAGVEPARVAPLVFETSASTDSAIWAFAAAKLGHFCDTAKLFSIFLSFSALD